jgi:hypothetical protein
VQSETWAIWFEGVRRIGVALHLVAIALGLATIIEASRSMEPSSLARSSPTRRSGSWA